MIISLYIMTICFCFYSMMSEYGLEDYRTIVLFIGIVFYVIADYCYRDTISELKDEIEELKKKKIDHIKE